MMVRSTIDGLSDRLSSLAARIGRRDLVESLGTVTAPVRPKGPAFAFIGEFGRGKTTLINALLGSKLLPTGGLPMQESYLVVRGSESGQVNIHAHFSDGTSRVLANLPEEITAIEQSSDPSLRILEIETPFPSLPLETTLLEAPGLGDINPRHRTLTEQILSQATDVILVLDATVAFGEMESQHLRQLPAHIRNLLVVINKVDLIKPEDMETLTGFVNEQMSRLELRLQPVICKVSAQAALDASSAELDRYDWKTFVEILSAWAAQPGGEHTDSSSVSWLRGLADRIESAVRQMSTDNIPPPQRSTATTVDEEERQPRRDQLERSRQQIERVIADQIDDMIDITADSFDAMIYPVRSKLQAGTITPNEAWGSVQTWIAEEEDQARERLLRLYRNVLEEVQHATHLQSELDPELRSVHVRAPTAAKAGAGTSEHAKTYSLMGGAIATLATRYFLLFEGGLGFFTSVSVGGLVAFAIWRTLSQPTRSLGSVSYLGEVQSTVLNGFRENFRRNAVQLGTLVQEQFETAVSQLSGEEEDLADSPPVDSTQQDHLFAELNEIRAELDQLEMELE